MITQETRRESNRAVDRPTRYQKILYVFSVYGPMTARQCAQVLGFFDLNAVKPRITELCRKDCLEAIGKTFDPITNRNVAVFALSNKNRRNDA